MLDHIVLQNFKLFKRLSIPLKELTVLSGNNSSGKSSVLQAIALIEQAYLRDKAAKAIDLNGELVELGSGADLYFVDAELQHILVRLESHGASVDWNMPYKRDNDVLQLEGEPIERPSFLASSYQYLRADRLAPQQVFSRSAHMVNDRRFLGARGEFTADFILRNKEKLVDVHRRRSVANGADPKTETALKLDEAIDEWLQPVSAGVGVDVSPVAGLDFVKLAFRYGRAGDVSTPPRRATHVGFGLTYALPIVTACLAAAEGDLLLIENPEAHLHPEGQAVLGQLLAATAAAGVQVLVETHSDHVINAIRLMVKRSKLKPEHVAFHFFGRTESGEVVQETPVIDSRGRMDSWPSGFFDQWDKALRALLDE